MRNSLAAPMSLSMAAGAISSCRHRSRKAEQRWPAERKAEVRTSSTTCSISAVESTIIALIAAGLGDERRDRAISRRERAIDPLRDLDRAGKDDAGRARIGDERGADRAVARRKLQRRAAERRPRAGARSPARRRAASARRAWRRRVAGDQRGGDLADEDREREIPGRNADEDAAPMPAQDDCLRRSGRAAASRRQTSRA